MTQGERVKEIRKSLEYDNGAIRQSSSELLK